MLTAVLVACGGDDTPTFPTVVSLGAGEIFPSIINSSLSVGENRVQMQLIGGDDSEILDATMDVTYYDLNGRDPVLTDSSAARLITADLSFIDENAGFEKTATGESGVYVTTTTFDRAGDWGAEIAVERDGKKTLTRYRFNVLAKSEEPAIGDLAPASVQATTATAPLAEIDSSYPLREAMHTTTVADALKLGRPMVIAFATPAFCGSRTCGPVMDAVIDPLFARYGSEVSFIHIEPYRLVDLREANLRNPVPAALEWRLQTEPWVFVVGADGRIAAKFEGIVAEDEVAGAIDELLSG
jgi:hypothetical protein